MLLLANWLLLNSNWALQEKRIVIFYQNFYKKKCLKHAVKQFICKRFIIGQLALRKIAIFTIKNRQFRTDKFVQKSSIKINPQHGWLNYIVKQLVSSSLNLLFFVKFGCEYRKFAKFEREELMSDLPCCFHKNFFLISFFFISAGPISSSDLLLQSNFCSNKNPYCMWWPIFS